MKLRADQRNAYEHELEAARHAQRQGHLETAFGHLERAHILGQRNTFAHTMAHLRMLVIGLRRRDHREILGQLLRIPAALTKSLIWVPRGNTGGANVNPFRPMPVPSDLQRYLD
ncbi:MAG: DUF3703 domain-containing protein [Pseudoxanthomonas sp.]